MDDLILRHAYSSSDKKIDAFYNKCDDAFDRFVAAVEDRFGVRANMIDSSEASVKYPFFALIKDWRNTGYDISGYISYDDDNDTLEIVYYAATTDHTDWCESRKGEDIIAWLDDKMVKRESRSRRGRMLKEAYNGPFSEDDIEAIAQDFIDDDNPNPSEEEVFDVIRFSPYFASEFEYVGEEFGEDSPEFKGLSDEVEEVVDMVMNELEWRRASY